MGGLDESWVAKKRSQMGSLEEKVESYAAKTRGSGYVGRLLAK